MVQPCNAAMLVSAFRVWKPPAACQVEPEVNSERSMSMTSRQPKGRGWEEKVFHRQRRSKNGVQVEVWGM